MNTTTNAFSYKNTINVQPCKLAKLAMLSYMREQKLTTKDFFYNCDPCGLLAWCTRFEWPTPELFLKDFEVYGSNIFQLKLVLEHNLSDDLNCDEEQNSYDALRMSEFNPIWFKFVHKIIYQTTYTYSFLASPIIEITPHWYEYLVENGYIKRFLLCKNTNSLMHELLLMCGDIESNPGPTYKEQCQKRWKRSKVSQKVEQIKEHQRFLREIREREEDNYIEPVRRIKVEMQIFSTVASAISSAGSVGFNYKASKTFDNISNSTTIVTEKITETLETFKQAFKGMENLIYKGFDILTLVTDIMFSLLQVSFAKKGKKIVSLSIELFRLLTKHGISTSTITALRDFIFPYFKETFEDIKDYAIGIKKRVTMQGNLHDKINEVIGEISPTHIVVFLMSILSIVFTSMIPKATQIEATLKRLGDLGRSSKGIRDFNEVAHGAVSMVLDEFKVNVLGLQPREQIEQFVSGIDRWFDETRCLLQRTDEFKKSDEILRDPQVIKEVENLYMRGLEFSKEISEKKLTRELLLPFQTHMRLLTDLNKMVDTSGAFGTRPRTQPVVIWTFGDSGVGKSGMSWPLAIDLNNDFVTSPQEASEFSKHIYMRNVEQEFWDNYQRQNIVIYDDFGQRKDSTGNPNEEFMELIRMANIAPYPLHMAHLEDKRKTRFTSKVILLSSNKFDQVINSLTFPDAFRRRVDLCARVTNVEGFTKMGYSAQEGKVVPRLDKKKVKEVTGEIISTDVYEIELIDPESGAVIETGLNYDEFLERALDKTREAFNSSKELNDFLEKYAERRFTSGATRKDVQMQIDDSPIFSFGKIDTYTKEQIYQLSDEGSIVNKKEKVVNIRDVEQKYFMHNMDDWTYGEEAIDIEERIWEQIRSEYFVRETKLYRRLVNCKSMAMSYLKTWTEKTVEFIKKHPFMIAATIIGTISAIFTASKFWTQIMGKPQQAPKIKDKIQYANITIKKYNDNYAMCGNDVSSMMERDILRFLPTILTCNDKPLIMKRPYPSVMGYLEGLTKNVTVYVTDDVIYHHGASVRLEAQTSGDNITLAKPKAQIEIQQPVNYGRQADGGWKYPDNLNEMWEEMGKPKMMGFIPDYRDVPGFLPEASTSNDMVTLQKPKTQMEIQEPVNYGRQEDGSWKYPDNLKEMWKEQGKPRMMGIVPDYRKIPGFLPEASSSSDAVTLQKPKAKIEANVSGDARTICKPRAKIEAHLDAEMQMWKDQVAQNLITNRVFSNLYKITRVASATEGKPLLHGLFVRNNLMLVPGHLLGFLEDEDEIELRNAFDVSFKLPWSSIKKIPIVNALGEAKEAALLVMPSYVSAHSDIVKHFSDSESMSMYRRADACIPVLRYFGKMQKFLMSILGNHECQALDNVVILDDAEKGEFVLRAGLEYKCPTMNGDCGAPLIINETQVLRKIAGIHVAGASDGMAYAESITQKDLQRAFKKVDAHMQVSVDFDGFCELAICETLPLNEMFSVEALKLSGFPGDKFNPVGKVAPLFEPCKTELRPSLVYGRIAEIKTKPAILRSKEVNMKHKNLQKCAMDTPYIGPNLIDRSYNLVKAKWLKNRDKRLARVLTWEESVMGSSDSEFLGPIKRQSSPGYPWILQRTKGAKGKTGWFGNDEYILSQEVKDAVDYRIAEAKAGRRVPTVWVDTLKDERRPIAKVDALKTRVFSNGPMDFTLAFRQYFLGFVAHLMENRITNEVCIGTNVYSQDWKKLALHLKKCGDKVLAGDFQNFDGTLNVLIMEKFADLANEFYNDGPENALIRRVLMIDVINSVHLCDGFIYMMTHSQPSGNPITTPLNCLVNSMGIRICFELIADIIRNKKQDTEQAKLILQHVRSKCEENEMVFDKFQREFRYSMRDAEKHLSIASYGDDDVVNFSDPVSTWFNMTTLTHAFELIGMTYTDEAKTQGSAPDWKTLEEVSFLKRQFRYDADKRVWEAPLSMDTILEMPNWCRGGLDIHEGTKVNCENAIMELSMHDKPVFDKWKNVIATAFYEATGDQLEVDTYRGYFQNRYMDYYAI